VSQEAEALARRAAGRLTQDFGAALPAKLEAAIHENTDVAQTYDAATLIPLTALLLDIAKFAWDIHKDRKKAPAVPPTQDVMARRIRMEVALPVGVTTTQRDQMVSVVLDELSR
jgi:hypothetical protein